MENFTSTRSLLRVAQEFEKNYGANDKLNYPTTEKEELNQQVFQYLQTHILITFTSEFEKKSDEILGNYAKKAKENNKDFKDKIWFKIKEKYNNKDNAPYSEYHAEYKNYKDRRNKLAHRNKVTNITLESFTKVELISFQGSPFYTNVIDIGEMMLKFINQEIKLQAGLDAVKSRDYSQAFKIWEELAEQGVLEAQYNLGRMYSEGNGVEQDKEKAEKLYRQATKNGYAWAIHPYEI